MLEGRRDTVLGLMERIRRDPRHSAVRVILEGGATRRMFRHWGMSPFGLREGGLLPEVPAGARRRIPLSELADDPRLAYLLLTGQARDGR